MLPSALIEYEAQQDTEGVWEQAHKIKGAAANVGAEALRSVALEVEQAAKAGDMTRVTILLLEMKIQIARLQEVLVNWANTQLI